MNETLTIGYTGNFGPSFSTESHVAASLELLGHRVVRLQEGEVRATDVPAALTEAGADLWFWTQTYSLAEQGGTIEERARMVEAVRALGIPSVGFHLDLWWGLSREPAVYTEPFFQVDRLFSADGDHDVEWESVGVRHTWSPPGVFGPECIEGTFRRHYASDVAFVGAHREYGHPEWEPTRMAMLAHLRRRYRGRFRCWPRGKAVRGLALCDLYRSVKVAVGDTCLADTSRYFFSDRYPETIGRGGFLIAPYVEGAADLFIDGQHCRYFPPGDWREMTRLVDYYLAPEHEDERRRIVAQGQAHVRENHTYEVRAAAILARVVEDEAVNEAVRA